jgi:hypothetical protein
MRKLIDFFACGATKLKKTQLLELDTVRERIGDDDNLSIIDAMTPNNFEWIWDTIKKAYKIVGISRYDSAFCWVLPMDFPVLAFLDESILLKNIVRELILEQNKMPDIYCRMETMFGLLECNKEDIKQKAMAFFDMD